MEIVGPADTAIGTEVPVIRLLPTTTIPSWAIWSGWEALPIPKNPQNAKKSQNIPKSPKISKNFKNPKKSWKPHYLSKLFFKKILAYWLGTRRKENFLKRKIFFWKNFFFIWKKIKKKYIFFLNIFSHDRYCVGYLPCF